jgi:glycosyltransferase involved in cell wall biosynthesis
MKSPKVSVVIPVYNSLNYFPDTLASVLRQTFYDFEVVIVDDGSTDNTAEWADSVNDERIRIIRQPNQGTQAARNTGILAARGEYIALLDNDDLWEPTKLQKQVARLDADPLCGLVYTWTMLIDELGRAKGETYTSRLEGWIWREVLLDNVICCGSTPMIRRNCFLEEGLFDTSLLYLGDWDMWVRLARKYPFAVVTELLVSYRLHSTNTSNRYHNMLEDFRSAIEKVFHSLPTDLLHLRNQCYGRAYLYLAWKPLNCGEVICAQEFYNQAIAHYPKLRFTHQGLRLFAALTLRRSFGERFYATFKRLQRDLKHYYRLTMGGTT